MSFLDAILLGIIQGLTEFLPVSSSGHIELGKVILGVDGDAGEGSLFTIIVHGATALSTIVIFRKDISKIVRDLLTLKWTDSANFTLFIIISMIPAVLVGLFLKDEIDGLFSENILLVGFMLLITGALLMYTNYVKKKDGIVNYKNSLLLGIAQAIAILPGISRSGATIATGLILGIDKAKVARFSFLMVLPIIFGAMAKDLKDYNPSADSIEVSSLIAGFIAAFVVGLVACTAMIKIVKKYKLTSFAMYCFIVGAIAIIYNFVA